MMGLEAGAVDKPTPANVLVWVDVPRCGIYWKHFYISAFGAEFNTFVTHFFCLKLHINLKLSRTKHTKHMQQLYTKNTSNEFDLICDRHRCWHCGGIAVLFVTEVTTVTVFYENVLHRLARACIVEKLVCTNYRNLKHVIFGVTKSSREWYGINGMGNKGEWWEDSGMRRIMALIRNTHGKIEYYCIRCVCSFSVLCKLCVIWC